MRYKETGNRDGSRLASVPSYFLIGRGGTTPQSIRSSLFLTATARVVELALDKEIE